MKAKTTTGTPDSASLFPEDKKVYEPRGSIGWVFLLLMSIVFGVMAWFSFIAYSDYTGHFGAMISIILLALLAIISFLMFIWFFRIRYELTGDKLLIYYGPLKYNVDLYLVDDIEVKTLIPKLSIALILPGFSKWVVSYKNEGKLFMCATRSMNNITIVRTKIGNIGLTPAREADFIEEVNKRIQFFKALESR
ncbi:PH domain-containing protein [Natranaerobius trueperi]|uniref:Uncharacterized protein n=1 Tax=Natranaerobius trueperi TaxID=759412 RepID=A0A226C107_9FIRM|nr:PH domain-containing protein [Natranaerobius trueperi]OWZ84712.1 hypothetical protein CDO51_01410 [Natranaerobius trueperi]